LQSDFDFSGLYTSPNIELKEINLLNFKDSEFLQWIGEHGQIRKKFLEYIIAGDQ
jgi:succinate dehydrogenase flavin-adding protein (antitoxin of CptAB toxin-antitoxin module)